MNEHKRKLTELERKANAGQTRVVVVWSDEEALALEDDEDVVIIKVVYADDWHTNTVTLLD